MTASDKAVVWCRMLFGIVFGGLLAGMGVGFLMYFIFKEDDLLKSIPWGFPVSGIYHYYLWKKLVKEGEDALR